MATGEEGINLSFSTYGLEGFIFLCKSHFLSQRILTLDIRCPRFQFLQVPDIPAFPFSGTF